jgi:predicted MFS family arabinose efflux permease
VSKLVPARPIRDSPTWAGYMLMASYAWFIYGFSATQALIRDEQGTSRTMSSLHAVSFSLGGIVAGLIAARLILTLGRGKFLTIAVIGATIGILIYTAPGGTAVTLTGAFVASLFGSSIIVGASAFLFDYQKQAGPAAITEANAFAAFGGLLSPLAIGIGSIIFLGWRTGLWILFIGFVVSLLLMRKNPHVFRVPIDEQIREANKVPFPRRFWWALATLFLLLTTEFTLTLWSADLLRERAGFEAGAAAASVAAVTGGIFIGRVLGSRLAEYFPVDRILNLVVLIAFGGWLVVWLSSVAAIMILGLVISGIGVALFWPLGISRVVMASGGQSDRASALASVAGATAGGIGPFALGAIADSMGVHTAFLMLPVALFAGLFLIRIKPVTRTITPALTTNTAA